MAGMTILKVFDKLVRHPIWQGQATPVIGALSSEERLSKAKET